MNTTLENKTYTARYFPYQISALCMNIPEEVWNENKDRILKKVHIPRKFHMYDKFPKYVNLIQKMVSLIENLDEERLDNEFNKNKLERIVESGKIFLGYFKELDRFVQEEAPSIATDENYKPTSAMIPHSLSLTLDEKRFAEILNIAMYSKVDNKRFYRLSNFVEGIKTIANYRPAFFEEFFDQNSENREIFNGLTRNIEEITKAIDYDRLLFIQKSGSILGQIYNTARKRK